MSRFDHFNWLRIGAVVIALALIGGPASEAVFAANDRWPTPTIPWAASSPRTNDTGVCIAYSLRRQRQSALREDPGDERQQYRRLGLFQLEQCQMGP